MPRSSVWRTAGAVGIAVTLTVGAASTAWGDPGTRSTTSKSAAVTTRPMAQGALHLAVISYWQPKDYARLPSGSLALVNPDNGIVGANASDVAALEQAVHTAHGRGVRFLGYVPTGYGDRVSGHPNSEGSVGQSLTDIGRQIDRYVQVFGADLEEIFFDETSQSCSSAAGDYRTFSARTRSAGLRWSAFNPGWVGDNYCYVDDTPSGDVVVTFESTLSSYLTDPDVATDLAVANTRAHRRGVLTWHLVDTAAGTTGLSRALATLRQRTPDYAYVTDIGENWQAGNNTWGSPPSYWNAEVRCLTGGTCR